jgi:sulfopyruvate decarboxylase subunit alpha
VTSTAEGDRQLVSSAEVHAQLKAAGIQFVSGLPDDWVVPLLTRIGEDPEIRYVPVARESEAVGVCAGAWFGGARSAAVMGIAGLLACGHELVTLNLAHQIPLLIVASLRGGIDDQLTYQVGQGMVAKPYLDALGIPHLTLDAPEQLAQLGAAYTRATILKRPFVVYLTKNLLLDTAGAA